MRATELSGYFKYAGVDSYAEHDLQIVNISTDRELRMIGEPEPVSLFNKKGIRLHHLRDRYEDAPLSFEVEIFRDGGNILPSERAEIERWLFHAYDFQKLYIAAEDPCGAAGITPQTDESGNALYLNCRFLSPVKIEDVAGLVGYRATLEADAPFVWVEEPTESPALPSTQSVTVSGDIVSFTAGESTSLRSLTAIISPIQDLHGYDSPWPAGGGGNLLEVTATSRTVAGVTFTVNPDGSVHIKGTTTSSACSFNLNYVNSTTLSEPVGTWKYAIHSTSKNVGIQISTNNGSVASVEGNDFNEITVPDDTTYSWARIRIWGEGTTVDETVYPMRCLSTETDSAWKPYSNICPISGRTGANIHVADSVAKYGVQFSGAASAGTRLYDAVGKVANVGTDTQTATNDFDNILPWSAMRRCNTAIVNGERVPTYYEGEAGFDNVNSDVFVYCPLFFYYRSDDDNTHVVSMSPLRGYRAPSKFVKADGTLRPYVFLPAYTAGVDANGVPVSRPGYWPRCISLTAFMTLCKNKHTAGTLDADIWIESTKDEEIIRILLDIEFATRDHQTVMQGASSMRYATDTVVTGGTDECVVSAACAGALIVGQAIAIGTADKGNQIATNVTVTAIDTDTNKITLQSADGSNITVAAGNYISSRPWKSGACDSVKTPSGSPISNSSAKMPCKYRGIENPWGNQYRWRWDYLQNDHQPYVLDDPDNYDGTVNAHYTALSYTVATSNGYAVAMGFDENFPHCRVTTNVTGGSSTTYFADYYYQNKGVRALLVGGDVRHGRGAGARYCYVEYTPGSAGWNIGAALSPA